MFQHTAARRRLHCPICGRRRNQCVSTHSRPKAAASDLPCHWGEVVGFNTQPPEGGCLLHFHFCGCYTQFQHTAARRRLPLNPDYPKLSTLFQHTAARRRLLVVRQTTGWNKQFQHTAARRRLLDEWIANTDRHFGFNTQPPEGGCVWFRVWLDKIPSFNTQPPEGGCFLYKKMIKISKLFTVFRYPLKYKEYQEV